MTPNNIFSTNFMPSWLKEKGEAGDVVLSCRIRLARNLNKYNFPQRMTEKDFAAVSAETRHLPKYFADKQLGEYTCIGIDAITENDREILVEKHLVSPNLIEFPQNRFLVVNKDATVAIMINEEDHFRIQCMSAGLNLEKTWEKASLIDDVIESKVDFAFDEDLGYLTSCPTNVGTGMRASVMVHVPALVLSKKISRILQGITKFGFSVRGIYGEGSEMTANVLQISNQITLGMSEINLINLLKKLTQQLIKEERNARQELLNQNKENITDIIWRAYGTLCYARKVSSEEAVYLLSQVALGQELGLVSNLPQEFFREMMIYTSPAFLQSYIDLDNPISEEQDCLRADMIREKMNKNYIKKEE